MMKNKKVVLLIVEGECEEILLTERLRELFKQHQIIFEVQRGDILFNFKEYRKPIKSIIGDKVKETLIKRKFKKEDILAILHIIDTDGCLIAEDKIVINEAQEASIYYQQEQIIVPDEKQKESIITRNKLRSRNIRSMNSIEGILSGKIAYRMYYLSRNLEHVIFDEPNPHAKAKIDDVEKFIKDLKIPLEDYLNQYMPVCAGDSHQEKYEESWNKVSENTSSLKRMTNVPLLFEYVKMKS
jgi:hypothetical protein